MVGHQPRQQLVELLAAPGRRHGDVPDVAVGVEVVVLDPERPVQPERHLEQPPAELRKLGQPFHHQLTEPLEAEPSPLAASTMTGAPTCIPEMFVSRTGTPCPHR